MIRLVFGIIMISYVWLIYTLLLTRKEPNYSYNKKASVVIPCYNETKEDLLSCIDSVVSANGDKEIILIDNNSKLSGTAEAFSILKKDYPQIIFLEEKKQGKRYAHAKGLERVTSEVVVFIDSDTIIHKNAIIELIKPFSDEKVGAVAGKVLLFNKKDNILTKAINSMFWTSGNVFRNATGNAGFMQVCAGALSAYRTSSLLKLEEGYLNQKFMGRGCAISDDRYLTMRVQTLLGQKVRYVERAVSYTVMPKTFMGFWKVLERWKRGVIREVLIFWGQPKKKAKLLFLDTQFNFITLNVMMIFKIIMLYQLFFSFSFMAALNIVLWTIMMSGFYGAYMITHNIKDFLYKLIYTFIYEFFWSFSYFNALWNIRNQGAWKTR